jgi:hypothetical protein
MVNDEGKIAHIGLSEGEANSWKNSIEGINKMNVLGGNFEMKRFRGEFPMEKE